MGAEPQNSFKGVARGPLYCKLTTSHKVLHIGTMCPPINHLRFLEIFDKKVG